jgi:septal ring factor EnvC (AmiA/AmiB activator)
MAENAVDKTRETQKIQETQDNAPAADDLDSIRAELDEEKKARAEAEAAAQASQAAMAARDTAAAQLQAQLIEAQKATESLRAEGAAISAELAALKASRDDALAHYRDMARAINPAIPQTLISGETIAEIDASIEKARGIVESVRKSLESEAAATRVPAGAPTRAGISTEGLSAREKIALGIKPKGES